MKVFVIKLFLYLCVAEASCLINRCLLSREDYVVCQYGNNTSEAAANKYRVHNTRIVLKDSGKIICRALPPGEQNDIPDLGTNELRILYSPGYNTRRQYDPTLRVDYRVECGSDSQNALFKVTYLDMQNESDCTDESGNNRCQDYLRIERSFGIQEMCGTTPGRSSLWEIDNGKINVVFRTSEDECVGGGFEMYIICYIPAESDLPGCIDASEFTSGMCDGQGRKRRSSPVPNRRCACHALPKLHNSVFPSSSFLHSLLKFHYSEVFPSSGFSPQLVMRSDLSQFHLKWMRLIGRTRTTLIEVDVLYNQTVNYTQNTITIMDFDGNTLHTYYNIDILETFNSEGNVSKYLNGFRTDQNPHFHGAGLLRIVDHYAFFQLFVIDPRGVVPNEEEERELNLMSKPLRAAIFINNTDIPREQRDVTGNAENCQENIDAILAALRSENACNPALKAQSRATLSFFNESNPDLIVRLRTFLVYCTVANNILRCTSDKITLPERTTCQVDNKLPVQCNPFRNSTFDVEADAENVIVNTMNCDGQTAKYEVEINYD